MRHFRNTTGQQNQPPRVIGVGNALADEAGLNDRLRAERIPALLAILFREALVFAQLPVEIVLAIRVLRAPGHGIDAPETVVRLGVARIALGGLFQTLQRPRRLPGQLVCQTEIKRGFGECGIRFQRRQLLNRRGEIAGPQIELPQVVVQTRQAAQPLPLDFELLARFVVALLREQTRGVLDSHLVVIGIGGQRLLKLGRGLAE